MVDKEAVEYFDSWKNPVVRELAPMMPGATPSKMAKSCCNEISAVEISGEWPGTATADYDSMALADVIDSCN